MRSERDLETLSSRRAYVRKINLETPPNSTRFPLRSCVYDPYRFRNNEQSSFTGLLIDFIISANRLQRPSPPSCSVIAFLFFFFWLRLERNYTGEVGRFRLSSRRSKRFTEKKTSCPRKKRTILIAKQSTASHSYYTRHLTRTRVDT